MHPSEVVQVNIAQSEHLVSPENSLNKLVQIKQDLDFYKYNKYAYQKEDIMEFFQHLVEINSPPDIIQTYKQKLGMILHKMSLITIFGHKHFRQKFHQIF